MLTLLTDGTTRTKAPLAVFKKSGNCGREWLRGCEGAFHIVPGHIDPVVSALGSFCK